MRSKKLPGLTAVLALILTAACGSNVTVQVLSKTPDGELRPAKDLPVKFLPFDRDSLFDVLATRASEPEPEISEGLKQEFTHISDLQTSWRKAESEWAEVRDSLKKLSDRMNHMDRRSRDYQRLFRRFNRLDGRERRLRREKEKAFKEFDVLQRSALKSADSVRAVREAWEDVAFADYESIEDSILKASKTQVFEDTTNADGYVTQKLGRGHWRVHTRLALPSGELYWNVPIPKGTDTLRLSDENGELRLKL